MITAPLETPQKTERLLEKSGRITPREVLEAYEATGYRPTFGLWALPKGSACAAYAIAAAQSQISNLSPNEARKIIGMRSVSDDYLSDFMCAFDGKVLGFEGTTQGYRDGQRVRRFVLSRHPEA